MTTTESSLESNRATLRVLRSGRFRAGSLGRFGQPVQIVESVMQIAAEGIGGALVAEDFPDVVVVVQRNHFDAADFFKEWGVLNFLERGDLIGAGLGGEFALGRAIEIRHACV